MEKTVRDVRGGDPGRTAFVVVLGQLGVALNELERWNKESTLVQFMPCFRFLGIFLSEGNGKVMLA